MMLIFILKANNDTNILILWEESKCANNSISEPENTLWLAISFFYLFIKKSSSEKVNQKNFYIKNKQTNKAHNTHNTQHT